VTVFDFYILFKVSIQNQKVLSDLVVIPHSFFSAVTVYLLNLFHLPASY